MVNKSVCSICEKVFSKLSNLRRHIESQHENTPLICYHCKTTFRRRDNLQVHLTKVHNERLFSCNHCSETFLNRHQLAKHLNNKHGGRNEEFKCKMCARIFSRLYNKDQHEQTCSTLRHMDHISSQSNSVRPDSPQPGCLSMSTQSPIALDFSSSSSSEIRRLIQAIKKYEKLYNPRHDEFGLRESQGKAWKAVATQVGGNKTDAQCRDKWNCLRGTYRRHVRTEAMNSVKRRSGWPWADNMSFIKKYVMDKDELAELRASQASNEKGHIQKQHKPNCPASQLKPVTSTNGGKPPGLTISGGIISGGSIIFNTNRVGIGIVQPNQGIGIVQPSKTSGDTVPVQTNLGVRMVHTTQPNTIQQSTVNTTKASLTNTDPIQVDVSAIKNDLDAPNSPAKPEFVDMDVVNVKKEPIEEEEEEEMEFSEFNFLPEECSQGSSSNTTAKPSAPEVVENDSNQLFMRSTVAHMRHLSAYDQSVFKLKVQQLLHEMMFPADKRD